MLIFDFDGILLNSVYEAGMNAYNTVTDSTATAFSELPPGCLESFVVNRFHFRPAGDSLPLMEWCLSHGLKTPERILLEAEYAELLRNETRPLKERTIRFFEKRKVVMAKDPVAWAETNKPYQPIWSALQKAGAHRVVILTNKNIQAVLELARYFGLNLEQKNIYTGDDGTTKIENLQAIHTRFKKDRYLFVDDSLGNLKELEHEFSSAPFRLELALGAWGYLGPDDRNTAVNIGYRVLEQQDLIDLLEKELPS